MNNTATTTCVTAPPRQIPVACDVDVLVAGTGVSGSIAAIAAARHGASVLAVDRFGQVGGNIGPGMWGGGTLHLAIRSSAGPEDEDAYVTRVGMGGIPEEFHRRVIFERANAAAISDADRRRLEARHYNASGFRMGSGGPGPAAPGYIIDSQVCSHVLLEMMDEAGVEILLSAYIADPIMEDGKVRGLFVETKSGRLALRARIVVDATGEADVCARAGAAVVNQKSCNLGTWFAIGGVDGERYAAFQASHPQADADDLRWSRETLSPQTNEADPFPRLHHLLAMIRKAWEADEFQFIRTVGDCRITINLHATACPGGIADGRTGTVGDIDFSDARGVTLMEREHRQQIYKYARFLRRYVPGFENAYLLMIAPYLNARGGRHLDGVRPVTVEDVRAQRSFDDVLFVYHDDKIPNRCDIPYRSLVPKEVDGLLAAGRASHAYGPNFRARCNVLMNGQAAGVAAALCAADDVEPRHLDVRKLQRALLELRSPLGEEDRLQALGLR